MSIEAPVKIMREGKDFTISKPWVALTDEEYQSVLENHDNGGLLAFYNLIEAKLKEKNG